MTVVGDPGPVNEACRALSLPLERLWLDYAALGGEVRPEALEAWTMGGHTIESVDYDRLVQALNERFADRDGEPPLSYADELD